MSKQSDYDVIVVGSGIAGHCAALAALRGALAAAAVAVAGVVAMCAWRRRDSLGADWAASQSRGTARIWVAALVLAVARQFDFPFLQPAGYWPRWAMISGMLLFDLGC